jgi:hypothetical protein
VECEEPEQEARPPTPMEIAAEFEKRCKQKKRLAALTKKVNERCTKLEEQVLNLIEDEQLPPSFRGKLGSSIYTRGEIWASPLEGNHARLTEVLRGLGTGWEHLLPTNVNSQTLSGIVRGAYNEDTDSFDLPPDLLTVLKITKKTRVVSNG